MLKFTNAELLDIRELVRPASTMESRALERKITDEIGDRTTYYDVESLICEQLKQLDNDQEWQALGLLEDIVAGKFLS